MKTSKVFVLIMVVFVLLLSACATAAPAPQAPVAEEAPAASEPEAEGEAGISGDLVYWVLWNEGEPQQQALSEIIADFENEYPDFTKDQIQAAMQVMDDGYLAQDYYKSLKAIIPLKGGQQLFPGSLLEHLKRCGFNLKSG